MKHIFLVSMSLFFLLGCTPYSLNNQIKPDEFDKKTYRVLSYYFSIDKNNVYNSIGNTIVGADPKTAKLLLNFYFLQDNDNIIFISPNTNKKIKREDIYTFIDADFKDSLYLSDKNNVYCPFKGIIKGADPYSFGYFGARIEGTEKVMTMVYSRDKNNIFFNGSLLENADVNSFRPNLKSSNIFDAEDKYAFYTADDTCITEECSEDSYKYEIIRTLK